MKLALDYRIRVDDNDVDSKPLLDKLDSYREKLSKLETWEGSMLVKLDGKEHCGEFIEPILRFTDQWLRKLPWIISGDTETVPYRNSERCFGFVPAGDSVELSFFVGNETEVEEYIIEPIVVRLDTFVTESLRMAERLLDVVQKASPAAFETMEDCRDLRTSLEEGKKAWRDYQLHNRR